MPIEQWLAFAAASAVLLAIPGPTILLVISYALAHRSRYTTSIVAGVALGDFTAMTASLLGLGALLSASAAIFAVLKWIGAAYLIYMGIRLWRVPIVQGQSVETSQTEGQPAAIFLHTYAVTALNPKSIVFFVAFLPQFLDANAAMLPQMAIFEATFLTLATLNATAYAMLASLARSAIHKPSVQRIVNRTGGTLMIGAGLLALGWKRASA